LSGVSGAAKVNKSMNREHPITPADPFERHFSVRTLAEMWAFSEDTVQRWFEEIPGVLKHGNDGKRGARRKVTIRIPESVAKRVYAEKTR
jgi:hypothetical protein